MTIQELYTSMGVEYQRVLDRLHDETRIMRYLGLFLKDDQMSVLGKAFQQGQYSEAFEAAHTLKGVCLNLDLKPLSEACIPLVEALRNPQESDNCAQLYERLHNEYNHVTELLKDVLA